MTTHAIDCDMDEDCRCGATARADTLSNEELIVACKNIGFDLSCSACAEQFFTGSRGRNCDATCTTKPKPTGVTFT